jgi:hypothetical protein
MAQIFHPSTNTLAKVSIFGAIFILGAIFVIAYELNASPYITRQDVVREQPVPFSHEHHVSGLGLDCRYCHTTVETSNSAGMPATKTCMTCHSQIWTNAQLLEPVRASWRDDKPVHWQRVHDMPDFVQFNHSVHIAKGIGCTSCHGEIDKMPLVRQVNSLQMQWCLQCHRNPEKFIRPRDQVFNMQWKPGANHAEEGKKLVEKYGVRKEQITNCSVCHY